MAQYTEILPDGTRREVKYNPHHDGPVSERITMIKRAKWLERQPPNHPARKELGRLYRRIQFLKNSVKSGDRSMPVTRGTSKAQRPLDTHSTIPGSATPQLKRRLNGPETTRIQPNNQMLPEGRAV